LRWFVLVGAVIPPYVQALAWLEVLGGANGVLQALRLPPISPSPWAFSGWVQFMALSPIAVGLTWLGLESVDLPLVEAARVMRPDARVLPTVILPMAAPLVLAGGGFVFLLSLTDYSVPSLFHLTVYPLEIFGEFSASNDPTRAFLLALPLLVVTLAVLSGSQARLRKAVSKPLGQRWSSIPPFVWPPGLNGMQRLSLAVLALQVLVPMGVLTLAVGGWGRMVGAVSAAHREILATSWTAGWVVLACLPLALCAAGELLCPGWRGRVWWFLVAVPLAVPAPLVGVGLIALWNQPAFPGLYDSDVMPILASLARFTPLAAIALLAQWRRVDPLLLDAARILERSAIRTWIRIRLPMMVPGLLAASALAFVLSAGELGATLIVAPPGRATLTMRIYNYLHYGASEAVAGLCLMMTVVAALAAVAVLLGLRGWGRLTPGAGRRPG
jgi:iron(III) transport system permease protein